MSNPSILDIITGRYTEIQEDWMPASQVRAFILEDPILVWLDHHGGNNGFEKDSSRYEFTEFIFEKGNLFESKWVTEMASEAVRVCEHPWEVKSVQKVHETWELMKAGTAVIWQGALWSAPENIYGVPDLVVHSRWLRERFPDWIDSEIASRTAPNLPWKKGDGHYLAIDLKFTTELDTPKKAKKLANYGAQLRIYSYMLGQLQGLMPANAYIVQRQPVDQLLPVRILSAVGVPLDDDLSEIRKKYINIKLNGGSWKPWNMPDMQPNMSNDQDGPWHSAKTEIAENYVNGSALDLIWQIGENAKRDLKRMGCPSRQSLLSEDLTKFPRRKVSGLGEKRIPIIRRILEANLTGRLCPAKSTHLPQRNKYEFFVDFEDFNNLNVDFQTQWPTLEGCPMIFMIGVGWEEEGTWKFEKFVAQSESHDAEEKVIDDFIQFIQSKTDGNLENDGAVALYHWSGAEPARLSGKKGAANRHGKPEDHLWRKLPWYDLQKEVFFKEPIGVAGAWNYELKEITHAFNRYNLTFNLTWPGDLDEGLRAMVMGWKTYQQANPISSQEMQTIIGYNEVDCKAMWKILGFLRTL